jgi:hypothetical protein
MSDGSSTFRGVCACGQVEFEGIGKPMLTVACYCNDCRNAGAQIAALSGGADTASGHSGVLADGGVVSALYRKDRTRCVRGSELLRDHKLEPGSPTVRLVATCCNSNVATRFDNWRPLSALRTFSRDTATALTPDVCVMTKFAPDVNAIRHAAPRYANVPASLVVKVLQAAAQLGFERLGLDGSRVY